MIKNVCVLAAIAVGVSIFQGCTSSAPENKYHAYSRSVFIQDEATEQAILAKAKVHTIDDEAVNNMRIVEMAGTPYEMGFQHGRLLKEDVRANLGRIYSRLHYFIDPVMLDEVYAMMEPYIPIEDKMEMLGLAHGADLPVRVVQRLHAVPELSEYKHKKRFGKKRAMLATSCSNVAAFGSATIDGEIYSMRILDWVRELGTQKYATLLVYQPDVGNNYVSFSYAGFTGCITGMNDQGITFGEMGYGNRPEETLEGIPFVFLFKKLMREADTLEEAIEITRNAPRTCSYAYLFADAKINDARLIISNRDEFFAFGPNETLKDDESFFPAIPNVVYGGAKDEILHQELVKVQGAIDVEKLQALADPASLTSNMQIVIMRPKSLEAWVANAQDSSLLDARSEEGRACNQPYYYIDLEPMLTGGTEG